MRRPRARPLRPTNKGKPQFGGTFQEQVVIQQLDNLWSQRQAARFAALAAHAHLRFGQDQVFAVEREHFAGSQTVEKHQADDGQIPRGAEAGPKMRHFVYRQRYDDALRCLHA